MTTNSATFASVARSGLGRLHTLLFVQTVVIILGSINRLGSFTLGYVAPNEFLRWVDFHNMLTLPLISLSAFYLLKKTLESTPSPALPHRGELTSEVTQATPAAMGEGGRRPDEVSRRRLALNLSFILGLYLLGASYGTHEVTNYLSYRFCREDPATDLCRIVIFNDDEFSHWVFFIGFVMVNAALMFLQVLFPHNSPISNLDKGLLIFNALFIALGIFANLAFEVIGLDLYVVALLAVVAVGLLWRRGAQPLLIYYSVAYVLGLVATFVYKTLA